MMGFMAFEMAAKTEHRIMFLETNIVISQCVIIRYKHRYKYCVGILKIKWRIAVSTCCFILRNYGGQITENEKGELFYMRATER